MGYNRPDNTEDFNDTTEFENRNKCRCAGNICDALKDLERFAKSLCTKCGYDEAHIEFDLKNCKDCIKVDIDAYDK